MTIDRANIKVLALWQPWASLLCMSDASTPPLKSIETRGWAPTGRLPFWCAIHASKTLDLDGFEPSTLAMMNDRFKAFDASLCDPPRGAIVGVVQVYAYRRTEDLLKLNEVTATERLFGDYRERRYGWMCRFPHHFDRPIPHSGKQGLYAPTPELAEQILIRMSESQAKRGVYGVEASMDKVA